MSRVKFSTNLLVVPFVVLLVACSSSSNNQNPSADNNHSVIDDNSSLNDENHSTVLKVPLSYYTIVNNKTAYIPPQCYTKVKDENRSLAYNPCFSCHTKSVAPNFVNDSDVQKEYLFATYATKNRYSNLFVDRRAAVNAISDSEMKHYIRQSNYFDENGSIILQKKLAHLPKAWDNYPDGKFNGYIPDCYFNFDSKGFDHAPNGSPTRWRAFGYYPFLGTFWPTNGSTDDVLIRLPKRFSQNSDGEYNQSIYQANLSIIEMLIKQRDINVSLDEHALGVDINHDGTLSTLSTLKLPASRDEIFFVGKAQEEHLQGKFKIDFGLYPVGTEFLHSVRYIDADTNGSIALSARIKELRYAVKSVWLSSARHQIAADLEADEKRYYPDSIKSFNGDSEVGLNNNLGWKYHAFIEDAHGDLRPQNYEELIYCMGCHGMIGATTDTIFTFGRKMDALSFQHGWFHWSQRSLKGVLEPKRLDGEYLYSHYLTHNGAGDEFRENSEIINKFFTSSHELNSSAVARLHNDLSYLLFPSYERAMLLNKAYYQIVKAQNYIYGRDATLTPVTNVLKEVKRNDLTGIESELIGY